MFGMCAHVLTPMCYAFLLVFTPNADTCNSNNNLLLFLGVASVWTRVCIFAFFPISFLCPAIKQRKQKAIISFTLLATYERLVAVDGGVLTYSLTLAIRSPNKYHSEKAGVEQFVKSRNENDNL